MSYISEKLWIMEGVISKLHFALISHLHFRWLLQEWSLCYPRGRFSADYSREFDIPFGAR